MIKEQGIREKIEKALQRKKFMQMVKQNYLKNKNKRAAVLYIQPVIFEDVGIGTEKNATSIIDDRHEIS